MFYILLSTLPLFKGPRKRIFFFLKGFFLFFQKKDFKGFFLLFRPKNRDRIFFSTLRYLRIWRETAKNRIFFCVLSRQADRWAGWRPACFLVVDRPPPPPKKKGRQTAPFWVIWTLKWRFWSQKFRRFFVEIFEIRQ